MSKISIFTAALFAMLGVIFGAFGAHYLKTIFAPDVLSSFETGIRYQMYHSFALLFVGLYMKETTTISKWIYLLFTCGILLFSGSIYALCYLKSQGQIGVTGLGILTPIGGVCFILAWFLMMCSMYRKH